MLSFYWYWRDTEKNLIRGSDLYFCYTIETSEFTLILQKVNYKSRKPRELIFFFFFTKSGTCYYFIGANIDINRICQVFWLQGLNWYFGLLDDLWIIFIPQGEVCDLGQLHGLILYLFEKKIKK